jgi:hypothetical protein
MGHINPDRMTLPPSPVTALTLAEMRVARWELRAACNRCRVTLRVNLDVMIRAYGPDAVWWGRKPRCPGFECDRGVLTYSARAIRGGSWVSMTQPPSAHVLEIWRVKNRPQGGGD